MRHLWLAFVVLLKAGDIIAVQLPSVFQSSLAQGPCIESRPTNCETHIAILDVAHKAAGPDGMIIMIGRLGDGERSRELNQHRLYSARAYLTEYHQVRSPDTIIIAEGERVTGYGRIELYVDGKLHTAFAQKEC